jgi:hypothetical protein
MGLTRILLFQEINFKFDWEILPVKAQQLLVDAGSYTFFDVAYLDVNRLVLT